MSRKGSLGARVKKVVDYIRLGNSEKLIMALLQCRGLIDLNQRDVN